MGAKLIEGKGPNFAGRSVYAVLALGLTKEEMQIHTLWLRTNSLNQPEIWSRTFRNTSGCCPWGAAAGSAKL